MSSAQKSNSSAATTAQSNNNAASASAAAAAPKKKNKGKKAYKPVTPAQLQQLTQQKVTQQQTQQQSQSNQSQNTRLTLANRHLKHQDISNNTAAASATAAASDDTTHESHDDCLLCCSPIQYHIAASCDHSLQICAECALRLKLHLKRKKFKSTNATNNAAAAAAASSPQDEEEIQPFLLQTTTEHERQQRDAAIRAQAWQCPYCAQQWPIILFHRLHTPSDELKLISSQAECRSATTDDCVFDSEIDAWFVDKSTMNHFKHMRSLYCPLCDEDRQLYNAQLLAKAEESSATEQRPVLKPPQWFRSMTECERHLKERHKLLLCQACLNTRQVFIAEHELFTRPQLLQHFAQGSPAINVQPHPFCPFPGCETPFYSNDEIMVHLMYSSQHRACRFCCDKWFRDESSVRQHYLSQHALCLHESCRDRQAEHAAFRDRLQLRQHEIQAHMDTSHMSAAQKRRLLAVDLSEFHASSSSSQHSSLPSNSGGGADESSSSRGQQHSSRGVRSQRGRGGGANNSSLHASSKDHSSEALADDGSFTFPSGQSSANDYAELEQLSMQHESNNYPSLRQQQQQHRSGGMSMSIEERARAANQDVRQQQQQQSASAGRGGRGRGGATIQSRMTMSHSHSAAALPTADPNAYPSLGSGSSQIGGAAAPVAGFYSQRFGAGNVNSSSTADFPSLGGSASSHRSVARPASAAPAQQQRSNQVMMASRSPFPETNAANAAQQQPSHVPAPIPAPIPQSEMTRRNAQLVDALQRCMHYNSTSFERFKTISAEFRAHRLSAQKYCAELYQLAHHDQQAQHVESLLLELIALLPDAELRVQLHAEYARTKHWSQVALKPERVSVPRSETNAAAAAAASASSAVAQQSFQRPKQMLTMARRTKKPSLHAQFMSSSNNNVTSERLHDESLSERSVAVLTHSSSDEDDQPLFAVDTLKADLARSSAADRLKAQLDKQANAERLRLEKQRKLQEQQQRDKAASDARAAEAAKRAAEALAEARAIEEKRRIASEALRQHQQSQAQSSTVRDVPLALRFKAGPIAQLQRQTSTDLRAVQLQQESEALQKQQQQQQQQSAAAATTADPDLLSSALPAGWGVAKKGTAASKAQRARAAAFPTVGNSWHDDDDGDAADAAPSASAATHSSHSNSGIADTMPDPQLLHEHRSLMSQLELPQNLASKLELLLELLSAVTSTINRRHTDVLLSLNRRFYASPHQRQQLHNLVVGLDYRSALELNSILARIGVQPGTLAQLQSCISLFNRCGVSMLSDHLSRLCTAASSQELFLLYEFLHAELSHLTSPDHPDVQSVLAQRQASQASLAGFKQRQSSSRDEEELDIFGLPVSRSSSSTVNATASSGNDGSAPATGGKKAKAKKKILLQF